MLSTILNLADNFIAPVDIKDQHAYGIVMMYYLVLNDTLSHLLSSACIILVILEATISLHTLIAHTMYVHMHANTHYTCMHTF